LKVLDVALTDEAVDPVGTDQEIGIGELLEVVHIHLESQLHSDLDAAPLEDHEELGAGQSRKTVTGRDDASVLVVGLDITPVFEALPDGLETLGIRGLEAGQRLVGEDNPPAKGVVVAIPNEK
jgi:hypothetical protein